MADNTSSKDQQEAKKEDNQTLFKVLIAIIALGIFMVILKGAGLF
jgi:Mg2+/citrate symporter